MAAESEPERALELVNLSRRGFLAGALALGGGLVLGLRARASQQPVGGPVALGPWIRIADDGAVTLAIEKAEMGQGVHTALAMLIAEELCIDWSAVRVVCPPLAGEDRTLVTGASSSVRGSYEPLRRVGAAAREMLVAAAAEELGVDAAALEARAGRVRHAASGRERGYGELAALAALRSPPPMPRLLGRAEQRLLGRPLPRVDAAVKVDGSARFGIDVVVPGMLHAAVRARPVAGGERVAMDERAALATRGVRAVVPLHDAVAVVADSSWQAQRGLEALAPRFSPGDFSSDAFAARLRESLELRGVTVLERGDPDAAFAAGGRVVSARYEVPFLAHATLEPMNATARVGSGECELWLPTQAPSSARRAVAAALGLPIERVTVHTTFLGGGFGRRAESDFAVQAAEIARTVGRPVKLTWSRAEDLRRDYYRPAVASELRAVLGPDGLPLARVQRLAGPSPGARDAPLWAQRAAGELQRRLDSGLVPDALPDALRYRLPPWLDAPVPGPIAEGCELLRYAFPAERVEYALVECPVPTGYWRSVGHSQNAFFAESFVDELAAAAGRDALDYRRALLARAPRARAVLERAAAMSGWTRPRPGRSLGIAVHDSFESHVCEVAEVAADASGALRLERVYCAIDCGAVVNPDGVAAQLEGSIVFGLSAALHGAITLQSGEVEQTGFHDYRLVGLADCPEIEVEIVASDAPPGGVGEPGTPPLAPALANAVFRARGTRLRTLPLGAALGARARVE